MKTDRFKQKLENEKARLESEMVTVGRKNPAVPDDWEPTTDDPTTESDIIDQADVIVNRETNAAILADLEARYDSILAALGRLEKGTYGKCEECGKSIAVARLEAYPAATTCAAHMK